MSDNSHSAAPYSAADAHGPKNGFSPVETVPGDVGSGYLVLCDHARHALPPAYGDLGLPAEAFERHIAYDIGARWVSLELARCLNAPAVLSTYSRLLIDPNRGLDDPTLIMQISDGALVAGNVPMPEAERAARIERYYLPYHAAITAAIEAGIAAGHPPAIISIHSFTPAWKDEARPWHVGILWDRDPRLALPLIAALQADSALVVGDNEPYSGQLAHDTLYTHGTERGLAHALVELRQDLIAGEDDAMAWGARLARIFEDLKGLEGRNVIRHFGSHTAGHAPTGTRPQSHAAE